MRRFVLIALVAVAMSSARSAEFSVAWDAAQYADLESYRVRIVKPDDAQFEQIVDVPSDENSLNAADLVGGCVTHCLDVRAVGTNGAVGPETLPVCGIPDPEIADVTNAGNVWRVVGDNFAPDVEAFVDGGVEPVQVTRVDCATLEIAVMPGASVVVRNPTDGVGEIWNLPFPGYLNPPYGPKIVMLECRTVPGVEVATVTTFSQSPGLNLGIVADSSGGGDDCAGALAEAMSALRANANNVTTLPLGESGEGSLYIIRR